MMLGHKLSPGDAENGRRDQSAIPPGEPRLLEEACQVDSKLAVGYTMGTTGPA